ncbi:Gfo/Idh/MocA family oxidoreductase [Spirulina subsalsa FACHB-351]|uniref:Gfo/Idh/MocA family oxidoreductase n=1 Tax=Spirulina subsalsa FACHB-351 TaxID=234711 RepID=A0ABT3L8Q6_9CYAN|nr:Gfo/Idh/MocA family oxidoreductase [Spirulina subsalsa]MCW6037897.1 Gfo/Idh/MocA family oxidoreductase [Spirulina subsalsa FACHB-351]
MEQSPNFKILVVGYGSIGQRHTRVLQELGYPVAIVSRHSRNYSPCYPNLEEALLDWNPDYVVIANRTNEHYRSLAILAEKQFKGRVLIEKPLFAKYIDVPQHQFAHVAVAYNLRFHPLLQQLKSIITNSPKVISVHIYTGSYLPNWRSTTDYRQSYSALTEQGGGVLRDLSHELDYVQWIFGDWKRLTAIGGKFSDLAITSDDVYSILMETEKAFLVSIHMNYLDKIPRREIIVNVSDQTIQVDLINNSITIDGHKNVINHNRDATYIAEHQAMIVGHRSILCTLKEASQTLETIEMAEKAATLNTWIQQ